MEVENEVKTIIIRMQCDKCGKGFMEPYGGAVLMSNPPLYPHKCSCCGHTENYTVQYPYTKYIW